MMRKFSIIAGFGVTMLAAAPAANAMPAGGFPWHPILV